VGQQVKLAIGAFDGLVATIVEMDDKDRLVVLLELMKQPVRVRLDAQSVFPV
jgi:transcriptional antiterminator RfaH